MLRRTTIFSFFVLLVVLLVAPVENVSAAWMRCRSDPVVILSNGLVLDLSADVEAPLWQVTNVDYTLHVPQGVSLVAAISTPAWPTTVETFTLIDDGAPGEYHAKTVARTTLGNAKVQAHTILVSALGQQLDYDTAAGRERQVLHTYVYGN